MHNVPGLGAGLYALDAASGCNYLTNQSLSGSDRFWAVADAGLNLAGMNSEDEEIAEEVETAEEDTAEEEAANGCFVAGTPVQMAHGKTKPIQKVKIGNTVMSRNPATGKTEAEKVVAVSVHRSRQLVTLSLADAKTQKVVEKIVCTPNHPFYVQGKGFVSAGSLGIGTSLVTRAGPPLVVASVRQRTLRGRGVLVYNFTVQNDHTYFVGTAHGGAWVHNDCTNDVVKQLRKDGEGAIIRVSPNPEFAIYLDEEKWAYHDVLLRMDGTVYDSLRPAANGLPFNEWVESWKFWQDYDFSYLEPEQLKGKGIRW